ncbi:hypothetical protein HK096_001906, partial [Nowakowskiella sp. JEL0078]
MSPSVYVRVRPLTGDEIVRSDSELYWLTDQSNVPGFLSKPAQVGSKSKTTRDFNFFSGIISQNENNESTFKKTVNSFIPSVLSGLTSCCFCYGHTGSGKSHTIFGYGNERGIYQHTAEDISRNLLPGLSIHVSFAEIYDDKIYDLLDNHEQLFLRED